MLYILSIENYGEGNHDGWHYPTVLIYQTECERDEVLIDQILERINIAKLNLPKDRYDTVMYIIDSEFKSEKVLKIIKSEGGIEIDENEWFTVRQTEWGTPIPGDFKGNKWYNGLTLEKFVPRIIREYIHDRKSELDELKTDVEEVKLIIREILDRDSFIEDETTNLSRLAIMIHNYYLDPIYRRYVIEFKKALKLIRELAIRLKESESDQLETVAKSYDDYILRTIPNLNKLIEYSKKDITVSSKSKESLRFREKSELEKAIDELFSS